MLAAGASGARLIAYATNAEPTWPGWGGLEIQFIEWASKA